MALRFDGTTADPLLWVLCRFPGCNSPPLHGELRHSQRCPEQLELLSEPPSDPESQQPGAVPLPVAQLARRHPEFVSNL